MKLLVAAIALTLAQGLFSMAWAADTSTCEAECAQRRAAQAPARADAHDSAREQASPDAAKSPPAVRSSRNTLKPRTPEDCNCGGGSDAPERRRNGMGGFPPDSMLIEGRGIL